MPEVINKLKAVQVSYEPGSLWEQDGLFYQLNPIGGDYQITTIDGTASIVSSDKHYLLRDAKFLAGPEDYRLEIHPVGAVQKALELDADELVWAWHRANAWRIDLICDQRKVWVYWCDDTQLDHSLHSITAPTVLEALRLLKAKVEQHQEGGDQ